MVYWYDIIEYIGSENRLVFRYLRFREKNYRLIIMLFCFDCVRIHLIQGLYCGCFVGQGLNLDISCARVYLS